MSSSYAIVISFTDELAARTIYQALPADVASDVAVSSRRALDGDVASWVMIATLGTTALRVTLNAIIKMIELQRVRSIKVGDVEVQNPSRADVERLLARAETAISGVTALQHGETPGSHGP
jgi:tRNA threonylcarbamoyladenosine modification (KEOPS) complex  Pcc1 subunit